MTAKFLIPALMLTCLALPAPANTPTSNNFSAAPTDQLRPAPQQSETTGPIFSPSTERARPFGTAARPLTDRHGNILAPPHMDAGGVPDPRI